MKKFRAWDTVSKSFLDNSKWIFDPALGKARSVEIISFIPILGDPIDSVVIEQYIDRNDTNNQEIYEGDIVRIYDNKTKRSFTGEVVFKNASFCIETDIAIHYRWIDYVITKLGNKYEDTQIILREGL